MISNEELEAALSSLRASTTESKAVLVECPLLKPDLVALCYIHFSNVSLCYIHFSFVEHQISCYS